jgi:hypothetical protein
MTQHIRTTLNNPGEAAFEGFQLINKHINQEGIHV